MGEAHFVICRDCEYTAWLEDYELTDFIGDHSGHKVAIFPHGVWEDPDSLEKHFRKFMGWKVEAE